MTRAIIVLIACAFLGACSTVKYNYVSKTEAFSIPELGVKVSAGLGEPLLDQGVSTVRDILRIKEESEIAAYKIKPGKLIKIGEDSSSEYFAQDFSSGYSIYSGLLVSNPDAAAAVQYKKTEGEYCIMRPVDFTVCGDLIAVRENETVVTNDSFRRTLIYSGRFGNKLKISYREFSNNLARSAFNTEVEYDLSESKIIGYAGARLEVIKATNTGIEYKVIKNFNSSRFTQSKGQ